MWTALSEFGDGNRVMDAIGEEIRALKESLGRRLLVLGHHYQRSSVLRHADEVGDSLELARKAASRPEAERIVFCGVRFMAESADILSGPSQTVYMPEVLAGCPMARMARLGDVERAWADLTSRRDDWLPVVYVNSSADIKAFCGERGGSACTSGNAAGVFRWALAQGRRIFFLPDEHLGFNTGHDLGLRDEEMALYDPAAPGGGLSDAAVARSRVVVWKGFCIVHLAFTLEQVAAVKRLHPTARIIVHPESPKDVVRAADEHGATSKIIDYVATAPRGSTIVIGTELNLVERLAERYRGEKTVLALAPSVCANMAKTNEQNLRDLLRAWPEEQEVHVPDRIAVPARKSLLTMLGL